MNQLLFRSSSPKPLLYDFFHPDILNLTQSHFRLDKGQSKIHHCQVSDLVAVVAHVAGTV